ncbi:hypothetical protein N658DRAFT_335656 [Parathielavia hyrcaniae]|uniref:Subtilisin-like serine protease n=1 Tax=Parathielavia hyrcaniae TaxID=113614 RepID=A0AAN6SX81_9PEZI|nr:hypothetical protein N658DRAFT_335656 [Parathielavia hyrcaniae]
MAPPDHALWPLETEVIGKTKEKLDTDALPATYHYYEAAGRRAVGNPAEDIPAFLRRELSLGDLAAMMRHLWFAGAKRPAMPLHSHVAMGREITVTERMDLHLLWDNKGKLFIKPVPRFLLDPAFCRSNLQCTDACACHSPPAETCRGIPRRVALGFLYTYACLVSSESDFYVANEKRLLPCTENDKPLEWADWKILARELLRMYEREPNIIHPRFLRAELRLSRINIIHRFTSLPLFNPYLRGRHNYGSLFRDNLTWLTGATVFVALVLTAMQVGLATERLQGNATFQQASYGFTIFAILGPLCAFGLVVLDALFHLVKDLPSLLRGPRSRTAPGRTISITKPEVSA